MFFQSVKHVNTFLEENSCKFMRRYTGYVSLVGVMILNIGLDTFFNGFPRSIARRTVRLFFVVFPYAFSHSFVHFLDPDFLHYYLEQPHIPGRHNAMPLLHVTLYSVINLAITRFNMRFFVLLNVGNFVLRHALVLYTNTVQRVHSYCLQKVESRYNIDRTSVLRLMLNLIFYAMSLLVFVPVKFTGAYLRNYHQSILDAEEAGSV